MLLSLGLGTGVATEWGHKAFLSTEALAEDLADGRQGSLLASCAAPAVVKATQLRRRVPYKGIMLCRHGPLRGCRLSQFSDFLFACCASRPWATCSARWTRRLAGKTTPRRRG
jgi:hypothetical protein